jgi:hypothetical protein
LGRESPRASVVVLSNGTNGRARPRSNSKGGRGF